MQRLYKMVEGYNNRFPNGNDPFQMVTRVLEECGEVASEVNHWQGSGIKYQKFGEPSKAQLANEIRQSLIALLQIAVYYSIEEELEKSIEDTLDKMKAEKLIN